MSELRSSVSLPLASSPFRLPPTPGLPLPLLASFLLGPLPLLPTAFRVQILSIFQIVVFNVKEVFEKGSGWLGEMGWCEALKLIFMWFPNENFGQNGPVLWDRLLPSKLLAWCLALNWGLEGATEKRGRTSRCLGLRLLQSPVPDTLSGLPGEGLLLTSPASALF